MARTLGAAQFGAFSLAYVTYAFALNASRGLATDPLMVRFSGTDLPTWRRAVASCTGTAAVVGLVAGACVLAAAALLGGTTRAAFFALGLTLPGLLLQDSWRYSFFALGRGSQAFLNDMVWASALVPALVFLRVTGHANVFWFVFAWGAAAAVAAAVGPLQARVIPRLSRHEEWVSRHRDLGPRYLAENTANSGSNQLRTYGVGLILGLAAVGYVQAAITLMGPFMVIFFGMSLVTVPEAARILRGSPRHLPLFCLLVSGGLALLGLAWGVALLVALPQGLGALAAGPDMAASLPAGAAAHDFRRRRVRHCWRHCGPARPGSRAAQPARDGPRVGRLCRLWPGGGRYRRSRRDDAGCRSCDMDRRAAVVVGAARGRCTSPARCVHVTFSGLTVRPRAIAGPRRLPGFALAGRWICSPPKAVGSAALWRPCPRRPLAAQPATPLAGKLRPRRQLEPRYVRIPDCPRSAAVTAGRAAPPGSTIARSRRESLGLMQARCMSLCARR